MQNFIESIDNTFNISDGEYDGVYGGWNVKFIDNDGNKHTIKMSKGIRGFDEPVVLDVSFGMIDIYYL